MSKEVELRIQTDKNDVFLMWLKKNAIHKSNINQVDYYLDRIDCPYFYLDSNNKLQSDYWLRVRINEDISSILCLKKVNRDKEGNYLYSDEYETDISNVENTLKIYENLGYNKAITVNKQRTEWIYDNFIIAYDRIHNLGHFFEVELISCDEVYETSMEKIKTFIFSILKNDYIISKGGYPSMIYSLK